MQSFLVISNIVLWLLVIGMAAVIFALTRQIGVLYERVAPAGALSMNRKLKVGDPAPELSLQTLDSTMVSVGGVAGDGRSTLVFFASPDCPVCKTLMPAVRAAARHEADWLRLMIASDGPQMDHAGYRDEHDLTMYPYVVSELLGKTMGVAKLPYAVLIDEAGLVAAAGIVNSREHLDSLFEAKERKVASIQDYLSGRQNIA